MSGAGSRGFGSGGGVGTYGGAASAAKWGFLAPEACSVNRTRVHRANVTECVREACERRGKGVFLREGDYDLGRVWDEPCEVDACCVLDMQARSAPLDTTDAPPSASWTLFPSPRKLNSAPLTWVFWWRNCLAAQHCSVWLRHARLNCDV